MVVKKHHQLKYKILHASLYTAAVTVFLIFSFGLFFRYSNRNQPTEVGVSFSLKQAANFELDPQSTLQSLTSTAGFKKLRLMSYWDIHEPSRNNYDFSELDWQFEQARASGATVSLAIGQRQPRWPECHAPEWAEILPDQEYYSQLQSYIAQVIERYSNHPNLVSYQYENEAANRLFGECRELNKQEFVAGYNLVKSLDADTPVIVNVSNTAGIPMREPIGDAVGFSIYKTAHFNSFGFGVQWHYWYVPTWWHGFRAQLIESLHNTPTFAHEVQAEPWGPRNIWDMSESEQLDYMSLSDVQKNVEFTRRSGLAEQYVWGGEWYVWRALRYDDTQFLDYFKLLNR